MDHEMVCWRRADRMPCVLGYDFYLSSTHTLPWRRGGCLSVSKSVLLAGKETVDDQQQKITHNNVCAGWLGDVLLMLSMNKFKRSKDGGGGGFSFSTDIES